jgi:hypothetical protein
MKSHLLGYMSRTGSTCLEQGILVNLAMCQSMLPPDLVWGLVVLSMGLPKPPIIAQAGPI